MKNYCSCGKEICKVSKRCKSCSMKENKYALGCRWEHSEKTKKKMKIDRKGAKHPFYNRHHTKNTKKKMSKSHKGRKAWNKNIPCSKNIKKKISIQMKEVMKDPKVRENLREKALQHIQNNKGPFKNTKPELKMKEILNNLNIPYETQFRLQNHLFDFRILNTNVLIEVDGDWFHGNPKKFSSLNTMQLKQKQKDLKNTQLAKENNYTLLRFWENEVLKKEEKIIKELKKKI